MPHSTLSMVNESRLLSTTDWYILTAAVCIPCGAHGSSPRLTTLAYHASHLLPPTRTSVASIPLEHTITMKASITALFAVATLVSAQSASDYGVPACAVSYTALDC